MRRLVVLLAAALQLTACSGGGADPSSAQAPTAAPSAPPPASASPTPVDSSTAPDIPSPSATAETWDLLWVSDSTGSGGTPWQYADLIRKDVDVEVDVTDGWMMSLGAGIILDTLRGRNDGILYAYSGTIDLVEAVREAEVIVVSGNPASVLPEGHVYCPTECSPPPDPCDAEMWAAYEATLQGIFDEIFKIRDGKPVILRTHDYYLPWGPVAAWEGCDCLELCLQCENEFSAAIHRAAASRGVPVADYHTTFSGPDGDKVLPKEATPDGMHPSPEFSAELARVMAALGYEPVSAPTQ
jgi:hypothetical protein